jgi:hypothetical protein
MGNCGGGLSTFKKGNTAAAGGSMILMSDTPVFTGLKRSHLEIPLP